MDSSKTAVIVVGHGSKQPSAKAVLEEVVDKLKARLPCFVKAAALQFNTPSLPDAIKSVAQKGFSKIIITPFFLYNGTHIIDDIPDIINTEKKYYPEIEFKLAKTIGDDLRIYEVLLEKIRAVLFDANSSPDDIEKESFSYIASAVPNLNKFGEHKEIVKRMVHTSGDLAIVKDIVISPSFLKKSVNAIKDGCSIFVDVKMVAAGINKKALQKYNNNLVCLIDDEEVLEKSKTLNKTRASISVKKAAGMYKDKPMIFVIGNAPTALFTLCELIKKEKVNVASVIGVPVGFVGASESKDLLIKQNIPHLTIRGTRGGSPIAASVVNSLLYFTFGKVAK